MGAGGGGFSAKDKAVGKNPVEETLFLFCVVGLTFVTVIFWKGKG